MILYYELIYETKYGNRCKKPTYGAAQGSILDPDLLNVNYDGILYMDIRTTHIMKEHEGSTIDTWDHIKQAQQKAHTFVHT